MFRMFGWGKKPGVPVGRVTTKIVCARCGGELQRTVLCITCKEKDMFIELTEEKENALKTVLVSLLEKPYKFGAEVKLDTPVPEIKSIDCSELVEYSFHKIKIGVKDGSWRQYDDSAPFHGIAKVGDLVFKKGKISQKVNHVGIYVGNNEVIEASGYYGKVVRRRVEEFKRETKKNMYAGIRRLLKEKVTEVT